MHCFLFHEKTRKCRRGAGETGPQGQKGPTGATGPTGEMGIQGLPGDPGDGFTGERGMQGETGIPGMIGVSGSGLSLLQVDNFGPVQSEVVQTYNVPADAKMLFVRLWGAGGGGGTVFPATNIFFTLQTMSVAGGGGGGGYAEGYITSLESSYQYLLALGGGEKYGNSTSGEPAIRSWFSDPFHLFADGGGGGSIMSTIQNASGFLQCVASGGSGGAAGGSLSSAWGTGSDGTDGFGVVNEETTIPIVYGGSGGAGASGSGNTTQQAVTTISTGITGQAGLPYGGGGGGSACIVPFTGTAPFFVGGRGSDAHLTILVYG